MMTETKWFKALSLIHLVVVLSICFCSACLLSVTILLPPALCAVFSVGHELIEHKYNVYDGLISKFLKEMKKNLKSLRFLPVWLLVLLQAAGIWAAQSMGNFFLQVILLVCGAFLLTFLCYSCAYVVFMVDGIRCEEVLIKMFGRVSILISIFCLMVLIMVFFSLRFLPVLFLVGSFPLLVIEAAVYLTVKEDLEKQEALENG